MNKLQKVHKADGTANTKVELSAKTVSALDPVEQSTSTLAWKGSANPLSISYAIHNTPTNTGIFLT
jgi:hypothetical protein